MPEIEIGNAEPGKVETSKENSFAGACFARYWQRAPHMNIHEYQAKELLEKFGAATSD